MQGGHIFQTYFTRELVHQVSFLCVEKFFLARKVRGKPIEMRCFIETVRLENILVEKNYLQIAPRILIADHE